ncbi:Protein of unknown function [Gryllus bimaculatus]|nr:Protein of unknown function [Gryllus bimaculatus]
MEKSGCCNNMRTLLSGPSGTSTTAAVKSRSDDRAWSTGPIALIVDEGKKVSGENVPKEIIDIIMSHLKQLHLWLREFLPNKSQYLLKPKKKICQLISRSSQQCLQIFYKLMANGYRRSAVQRALQKLDARGIHPPRKTAASPTFTVSRIGRQIGRSLVQEKDRLAPRSHAGVYEITIAWEKMSYLLSTCSLNTCKLTQDTFQALQHTTAVSNKSFRKMEFYKNL